MNTVITIVNFIHESDLNHRESVAILEEFEKEYG
jgi:hypothetical protein